MTRGVTLPELMLTLVLIGLLAALGLPRLGAVASAAALRHEATELVIALDAARLDAIRFGAVTHLTLSDSSYRLELATDSGITLRWQHDGAGVRGVRLTGGGAPIQFGAAGLALGVSNRTLVLTRHGVSRRVVISRLGRITP
jgi:prepilin-type N-terminal cleavage/methylation domain-containing protein